MRVGTLGGEIAVRSVAFSQDHHLSLVCFCDGFWLVSSARVTTKGSWRRSSRNYMICQASIAVVGFRGADVKPDDGKGKCDERATVLGSMGRKRFGTRRSVPCCSWTYEVSQYSFCAIVMFEPPAKAYSYSVADFDRPRLSYQILMT